MIDNRFTESIVEEAALVWLEALGYAVLHGPDIAHDEPAAERTDLSYRDVILEQRFRQALVRLNPHLPSQAIDDAYNRITRIGATSLIERNRVFQRLLIDGVSVQYRRAEGGIVTDLVWLIDFEHPENNDWLAVNQFTIAEGQHRRRPDIVLFANGLPVAVIELKNAADEEADWQTAFVQLVNYQAQIPSLFTYNAALVASDGSEARIGAVGAGREWFKPWRTITGEGVAESHLAELHVLLSGVFEHGRFLDLIRHFTVFEDQGGGSITKKIAGYHQFHAVRVAVEETVRAMPVTEPTTQLGETRGRYLTTSSTQNLPGDRRIGVVWHTQGSGKSLTMAFYAAKLYRERRMDNPTIVVLTDRIDLDNQLFDTFSRCRDLLRQEPEQAADRTDLRTRLQRSAGGIIFTTIQKFLPEEKGDRHPLLSTRRNIVVIADEAHRSQYDFIDGFARYMRNALPQASFIGFTGTPIEQTDANTRAVFGDYISIYDIERAVRDGATVPIYYENRLPKLQIPDEERPRIDPDFEDVTEGEEVERKAALGSRWSRLAAIVGAERRLEVVARDLVGHWEERLTAIEGKAMVVCMTRGIAVDLYRKIVAQRPEWHSDDDEQGTIKVIMTGDAADPPDWQPHIRSKGRRTFLANRFRNPSDPFQVVIVRDMWLTGFDAPSLHTMYVDKPMRAHGLMQAIARVNRVFRDKPGGLIVDYLGLGEQLQEAVAIYTESGGAGRPSYNQADAVATMHEKYEICLGLFHGFDWSRWYSRDPTDRVSVLPAAQDHIYGLEDGKERLLNAVLELSKAFALAVPHEDAISIQDDVGFFQAVRANIAKRERGDSQTDEELDYAVRQIVGRAVASDEIVDIYASAGLKKPDISIISEEFLAEVRVMPQRNLAAEVLRKLLLDGIRTREKRNLVQARSFRAMLEESLSRYHNRAIRTVELIDELLNLATEMRAANERSQELGLSDEEMAFYDALSTNGSAVEVMGKPELVAIARELARTLREHNSIDWTVRENVRAQLRVYVKRILRRHGYPPDKQERATQTVIAQAELLSETWVVA